MTIVDQREHFSPDFGHFLELLIHPGFGEVFSKSHCLAGSVLKRSLEPMELVPAAQRPRNYYVWNPPIFIFVMLSIPN
jgi:hypothetical protein